MTILNSKFGTIGLRLLLYLGHLVQVLVHRAIALDLWCLVGLQVVRPVGVDLHFRLAILGLGEVLLQLDADELPLISLLGDAGGGDVLDDLFEIGVLVGRFVAFGADDGVAAVLPELEAQVELLSLLRAVIRVHEGFLSLVELFQVHDVQFLQMTIFLHLTAATTAYLLPEGGCIPLEPVRSNL